MSDARFRLVVVFTALLLSPGCFWTKQSRIERYVAKGYELKEQKRYPEALAQFEKALTIDSHYLNAVYGVGITNMEMGNFEDAYRALKTVVVNRPEAYNGNRDLARLLMGQKRFKESRPYAQAAYDLRHGDPEAQQLYLGSFSGVNDLGHMEDALRNLVVHDAASLAGAVALATKQLQADDMWAAEDVLKKWVESVKSGPSYQALGNFYWSTAKPQLAEQSFQKSVEVDPRSPILWYSLGLFQLSQGHPDAAEPAFQKLAALSDPDARYSGALGRLYIYEGSLDKGVAELDPVVKQSVARFPEGRLNFDVLMMGLIEAGKYDPAKSLMAEVGLKAKDDLRLKMYHGILALKDGAFLPAERELDSVAEQLQDSVAEYYAGLAHQAMEDDEETLHHLRNALKDQPANLGVRLQLADYLANAHSNAAAATLLNEAPSPQERFEQVRLAKARMAVALGEWISAEQDLQKLIEENPKLSGAYTQLGVLYAQKQDPKAAGAAFDKALQLNPKDETARAGKKAVATAR